MHLSSRSYGESARFARGTSISRGKRFRSPFSGQHHSSVTPEQTTEPKSDRFEPIGIDGDPLDFFDFDTQPEFFGFFCQLFTIQEVNRRSAIPSCLLDRFPWKSPCCYKKPFVGSANHSTA